MPAALPFNKLAAIAVDYEAGMLERDILKKHGVSRFSVTTALRKFEVKRDRRPRASRAASFGVLSSDELRAMNQRDAAWGRR